MGLDCSWQWWSLFCSWPEQNKDHHCQLQAKKLQLEIQWMKTRTTRSAGRGSREWTWVNFQNSNEGIVCYWMNCRWHWRHDKHKIRTHMQPAFTQKNTYYICAQKIYNLWTTTENFYWLSSEKWKTPGRPAMWGKHSVWIRFIYATVVHNDPHRASFYNLTSP